MPATSAELTDDGLVFLADRHLATLTTLRADGTPHVTPVGFSWDADTATARVICSRRSQKALNAGGRGRAVLCQVDGARWLTLEGTCVVSDDPARVAEAVSRYAARYQQPRENPERVAIEIVVTRILGSAAFLNRD